MVRTTRMALGLAATLAGCAAAPGPAEPPDAAAPDAAPPPIDLFAPDHVLEVVIELAPDDWTALRRQSRSWVNIATNCGEGPFLDPFTYFPAAVTIDGERLDPVGVRKKGFLGSLSTSKPSLKLDLDHYVEGQRLHGVERLTLNNAQQDPSYLRQCLSYQVFASAGIPAPRCGFAHVVVNGVDRGLYVNVEAIDARFLRRHFGDDAGNLYEGTFSDFRPGWTATFELDTNQIADDRRDLDPVVAALELPDDQLVAALDATIDLDAFLRYWAAEVLLTHWDGYAGNANNYFAYHDPATGRFRFLPWGTDQTFLPGDDPFGDGVVSTRAVSILPRRLYLLPETRDRYVAALRDLLAHAWDEGALLAEIERMEALITPIADRDGSAHLAAAIEEVRDAVRGRRAAIDAELASGPPAWSAPLREVPCAERLGSVTGTVDTTFGTTGGDPFAAGDGALSGTIEGAALDAMAVGATAGWDPAIQPPALPVTQLLAVAHLADGDDARVMIRIAPGKLATGAELPIDWVDVVGVLYRDPAGPVGPTVVGLISAGTVRILDAGLADGHTVRAWFSGTVIRSPW